ncbi:SgcJ/EcaC family oxidoreductase [Sphingomonas ginkgonis]|uniref:SgcJ/EcaC family oxidoreductase n=1 Tax=Sphingomonas ginkgonis TaxID=2315330 RepID=A0A3R9WQW3_9SPHN|nr:SgcJ/EcaC family oxidoreductase [Sphingomonas ginkgonis]RST29621.1 SgcJ/EcaC family oxidoreductase [Sphingomonas ginkgonis]
MIDRAAADALCAALTAAWNAGDGDAFAAVFSPQADFVNVLGHHACGRDEIAAGHRGIFESVYKGSRNRFSVQDLRDLGGLALMHVKASLDVAEGPMAGAHEALMSVIVDDRDGEPCIVALHNTFVREMPDLKRS